MVLRSLTLPLVVVACLAVPLRPQQSDDAQRADTAATSTLTLKKLFPEKGLFGPSASDFAFSHDGKHAAYLYRPYDERRHGSDLWLYDTATRETRRLTSVTVMARFQKAARKVEEQQKAERAQKGKNWFGSLFSGKREDESDGDGDGGDEDGSGSDGRAPRYGGIDSFTWSPNADELLFTSAGDIYRWRIGDDAPQRLTMTREREHDVQYLPDGGGYTFLRGGSGGGGRRRGGAAGGAASGNALIKVEFGSHLVAQLDPELADGESMSGYRFSDDGKHVVFLASKGDYSPGGGDRKVNIARYRDRFMQVQEVSRHVSDDPMPDIDVSVYLHDLSGEMVENGTLTKVYTFKRNSPRDTYRVPSWSPDSSRVAFCVYKADTDQVHVMEVEVGAAKKKGDEQSKDSARGRRGARPAAASPAAADHEHVAKVVHRFLHNGGPTTPSMITPYYLADSRHIVFLSEQSGFRHLHVLDPMYESVRQLTHGHFEVYPLDLSKDRKWMFVLATREDPACQDVYRVAVDDGRMERLSHQRGFYSSAAVAPDGGTALATFVRYGTGPELVAIDCAAAEQTTLTDSHPKATLALIRARPTFFTYQNRNGQDIHGTMFKPRDWSPADKRPLLVYVYGGPLGTRKNVVEGSYAGDGYMFGRYMTERHGYVTCTIDPRGMSGYGGKFEKANYEQVGKPQVEDLVDGVKFMIANHGVDAERVGIHGWSFGGFQTQMCLYTEPEVFACGIAGAGPTEWENYNSWYSLGTIGPSRPGQPDLKKFSLLPLAKNLKARLLLVHGMEDSNVLYQDTVRVYRELLKAGKETLVELFLDPTGGHGLGGDIKRLGKARKYEEFFVRVLGEGERSRHALDTTVAGQRPQDG